MRIVFVGMVLLPVALGVAVGEPASWGWMPVQQLTLEAGGSNLPLYGNAMAVQEQTCHVVFGVGGGASGIRYLRSTDGGAIWEPSVVVDDSLAGYTFSVAGGAPGIVHFLNRRPSGTWYRRSTDGGGSWLPPQQLTDLVSKPILAADEVGNVYVFDAVLPGSSMEVRFWRSADGGVTWEPHAVLATRPAVSAIHATVDPAGRVHLAYSAGLGGQDQVYYSRSTDNGVNWEAEQRISNANGTLVQGLWWGGADEVYASLSVPQSQLNFQRSTDGGATWLAQSTVSEVLQSCTGDTVGRSHALTAASGQRVVYYRSLDNGATWTDTVTISPSGNASRSKPVIVCSGADLFCIWNGRETGRQQVYFRLGAGLGAIAGPGLSRLQGLGPIVVPNPARRTARLLADGPATVHDASGRQVATMRPGDNSIAFLRPGVYVIRTQMAPGRFATTRLVRAE